MLSFLGRVFGVKVTFISSLSSDMESTQVTKRVSAGFRDNDWGSARYAFMFIQDMYEGIMPFYRISGSSSSFSVKLRQEDAEAEEILKEALSDRSRVFNLSQAICDFTRDVAQHIFWYGVSMHEVSIERDTSGKIESLELIRIQPTSIKKILNYYIQYIPKDVKSGTVREVIVFPERKILRIGLPKSFGGKWRLMRILKRLKVLGGVIFPEFTMEGNPQKHEFSSQMYHDSKELELAVLTKDFGWSQRGAMSSKLFQSYEAYTMLKNEKAKEMIRRGIFDQLDTVLVKKILQKDNSLVIKGLPTLEDIERLSNNLKSGDVDFSELYKSVSY